MSSCYRIQLNIFQILLIAWLFCSSSIVNAQVTYPETPSAPQVQQQQSLRKFTFKHAKAADAFKILAQLSGDDNPHGIAVDERTNSLIFLADDEDTRESEAFYSLLDAETPAKPDPSRSHSVSAPAVGPQPLAFDISMGIERGESIESLKQRYNELEQQSHQLADKLRQIRSSPPYESELSELQASVRKSFEARQALQRAELADLAQRMKSMQQSIDMRDKLADKVVERRVEDLLDPNLKWDAGKVSEQLLAGPNQGSSNPAMPLPPSPFPSNVSVPSIPGERPSTVIKKRMQGRWIVQTHSEGNKDALADLAGQVEVEIEGNSMRYLVGKEDTTGPIFLADCKEIESPTLTEVGPLPIDFVYDPNGDPQTFRGIIACDGTTLSICMAGDEDFRPSLFVPGTKVILIKCRRSEPKTADAVSVDKAIWKSPVQQATSKLLAAFPVPPAIDQNDFPKVIAIVDVDYQGKQEAGNLKEEIYEWIAADIPFAPLQGSYALLSRSAVKLAMQETGLRPRDLARSSPYYIDNRQKLLNQLRSHELKVDALLITSLKHREDSEDANQDQFELTLEGYIDARTTWLERVNINRKPDRQSGGNPSEVPREWNDFLNLLPEYGKALVMFSHEPEIKDQMLPVAKKVAEEASAKLIELPQITWHKIIAPPATHFVLMKDRQLVGTRTGLMTKTRLQDFVAKAKDWLTPRSTEIDEKSLVRVDCFISPGTDKIGSQHGGAHPITTAVVAVHQDQALLLGPESIGEYIARGYACVAIIRDAAGTEKQIPLDVVLKGPVKLVARGNDSKKSAATASISFGDDASKEIPLPFLDSIYPKSITESLEAYDVGSAIYRISGAYGLTPVKLAAVNDGPKKDQRVLSGSFTRDHHSPPLHGFRSPIHWQSQTVPKVDGHIYGGNINGAEMFEVLCPTRPAPCGFTFNEHGRLIGKYGLGEPSEKDMTHTVFKPDTTHSVLQAALEKIDDAGLKAALAQSLEESQTAASIKDENRPAAGDAANARMSQPSTSSPAKFETPQELLARVDECSNNGSYEEFVSLFSDDGVRDLAGSLLVSAMQMTTMSELAKQNGGDLGQGPARIQEALNRWLKPNPTPEQQQAESETLSLMYAVGFGGPVQDKSVIAGYVEGIRKSAERVTDLRKFSVDMLSAYHELTGEPFGYFGKEADREWQVTQSGDKAVATLVLKTEPTTATAGNGSSTSEQFSASSASEQVPVMTMTDLGGAWRISSLFDELLNVVKPNMEASSAATPEQSNSKTITRRYSVGSFITDGFFTGKGSYDTQEVYDKYETEIEQSLQDLVKTVTAACTQPPKFVQVLSSSRCLLIGHTEAGHQEIARFMSDIGINNDRIRLRFKGGDITSDEAKMLGIELTLAQRELSPEEVDKLWQVCNLNAAKLDFAEKNDLMLNRVHIDETVASGTRTSFQEPRQTPQSIAARIVPGTKQIQIRFDMRGYANENVRFVMPRFHTLTDGQSVLFTIGGGSFWVVTADIVHDAIVGDASVGVNQAPSSTGTKYSGQTLPWWLDTYWDNATASPQTAENLAKEYAAAEAIRKLGDLPESEAAIEAALAKWFSSVEHEVNEIQLMRVAKCMVCAVGPKHQEAGIKYLFKIAKQLPLNPADEFMPWMDTDPVLSEALCQLVLNDELAVQVADRLKAGTSAERYVAIRILFFRHQLDQLTSEQVESSVWVRAHVDLFLPAYEAASHDENETIRMCALVGLVGLNSQHSQILSRLTTAIESDPSTDIRCTAIQLLCAKEMAPLLQSQGVSLQPLLSKTLEAESVLEVKNAALEALLLIDSGSELVHSTLLQWARSEDHQKVENALALMLRDHKSGDRPLSVDELIELLSDPEWGMEGTITERIPSGIFPRSTDSRQILARQHAIGTLGQYAAHAHRALPTLEAELARNNKDTLAFATKAIDSVRGYCPDRPIDTLQGQWEFVSVQRPEGSTAFFELQAASHQQPATVITVSGTQLKLGDRLLGEISHHRQSSGPDFEMLLDPDGKKRHCNGSYEYKGGPSPEYKANTAAAPEFLVLEVCDLQFEPDATEATKQTYEFRPVKK